jgi:diphthamide biosynthesis methyltransferase
MTLLKREKKKHTRQYKNLDKQNTKMRRSLATAILLNLKEKKKKETIKNKSKRGIRKLDN